MAEVKPKRVPRSGGRVKKAAAMLDLPTLLDAIATAEAVETAAAQAEADAYGVYEQARVNHGEARYASVQAQTAYTQAVADLIQFLSQ